MPSNAIITGVILVIMVFLLAFFVEFFLPLSIKADLDMACRNALLRMENAGGLSSDDRDDLQEELENEGFTDIVITATASARMGEQLTLHVEGDYAWNRITELFKREEENLRMVYDKTSMSRKVVN